MRSDYENQLDADTLRYVVDCGPLHNVLLRVLTQIAGFSLLIMTSRNAKPAFDDPIIQARETLFQVSEKLRALKTPNEAGHHHHHMFEAAIALERGFDLLYACLKPGRDELARETLSRTLHAATDHLRAATKLLPGFEMVDLSEACCAVHAREKELIRQEIAVS